jgi:hypothetical protein
VAASAGTLPAGERELDFEAPPPAAFPTPAAVPSGERELDFEEPTVAQTAPAGPARELASPTLAELYASQGHVEDAVAVYREVVAREPERAAAESRLAELEHPTPEDRVATRRAVLQRTIARLEALQGALREARP